MMAASHRSRRLKIGAGSRSLCIPVKIRRGTEAADVAAAGPAHVAADEAVPTTAALAAEIRRARAEVVALKEEAAMVQKKEAAVRDVAASAKVYIGMAQVQVAALKEEAGVAMAAKADAEKAQAEVAALQEQLAELKEEVAKARKTAADEAVAAIAAKAEVRKALGEVSALKVAALRAVAARKKEAALRHLGKVRAEVAALKSLAAISASENAAKEADTAISQASVFLKQKQVSAKQMGKGQSEKRLEEIAELSGEEWLRRGRMEAIMAEAAEAVTAVEKKLESLQQAVKVFSGDDIVEVSATTLKEASEAAKAAEKELETAAKEASKVLAANKRDSKGPELVAITKLQGRLNKANTEAAKHRKLAMSSERLIKGKEVLTEETEKVDALEKEVAKVEKLAKPAVGRVSPAIKDIDDTVSTAMATLKKSTRTLEHQLSLAPPGLKAALQKLLASCKELQTKLDAVKAATQEQRETVLSEFYVELATSKTHEVEKALQKVNEAELPFLKGIEEIALAEATKIIEESEAAAELMQTAVSAARTFIAVKHLEMNCFDKAISKPAIQALAELSGRVNTASHKLSEFRKDTPLLAHLSPGVPPEYPRGTPGVPRGYPGGTPGVPGVPHGYPRVLSGVPGIPPRGEFRKDTVERKLKVQIQEASEEFNAADLEVKKVAEVPLEYPLGGFGTLIDQFSKARAWI